MLEFAEYEIPNPPSEPQAVAEAPPVSESLTASDPQNWQELQRAATQDPIALLQLADLALEGNFPAEELLFAAQPELRAYGEAALADITLLPRLALLAELGCANVQGLLVELVAAGPQDFFFSIAGVAAEGSYAAFAVLNQAAGFDHLAALIGYAEIYAEDSFYGPMLRAVLQNPEFCPAVLDLAATGDTVAGAMIAKLAELGNPTATEWLRVPAAVNWQ